MPESHTLATLVDRTREYARFYLSPLKGVDMHRRFSVDGKELNTAYWLVAHMAVSENWLLLRGTGGPFEKFSWAKHFNIGSTPPPMELCPPYEEVWAMFKAVHEKARSWVAGLGDEQLNAPHQAAPLAIAGMHTVRDIIMHHCRHEALHTGQLAWLCKLHGIRTV